MNPHRIEFKQWRVILGQVWLIFCLAALPAWSQQTVSRAEGTEPAEQVGQQPAVRGSGTQGDQAASDSEFRVGPEDVLQISVFEAPDLNRTVRVSSRGQISLPPLGVVNVAGLTSRQCELLLQDLLRRSYVKDPHVSVFVKQIESHPVYVFGMVDKPGMFEVRGEKSLIQILSMAGGVLQGAGDTVLVLRASGLAVHGSDAQQARGVSDARGRVGAADPEEATTAYQTHRKQKIVKVNLKQLLQAGDPLANVPIYAGDVVTVPPPSYVYVVGDVSKPGAFPFRNNESLWQVMSRAGGTTSNASKSKARIIRVDQKTGRRIEVPVDLNKVLLAKSPGPELEPDDIVYVPTNTTKRILERAGSLALTSAPGAIVALIVTHN